MANIKCISRNRLVAVWFPWFRYANYVLEQRWHPSVCAQAHNGVLEKWRDAPTRPGLRSDSSGDGQCGDEVLFKSRATGRPYWANNFFQNAPEYLATRGPKNEARNAKMNRGEEIHPTRVNARYEMNWANSFFKKFRKPCLQTDGPTDIRVNPVYPHSPSVERGV